MPEIKLLPHASCENALSLGGGILYELLVWYGFPQVNLPLLLGHHLQLGLLQVVQTQV